GVRVGYNTLYHPTRKNVQAAPKAAPEAGIGWTIYENFQTVVILKQQVRVTNPIWQQFLSNFRMGQVEENNISILHSVTLTHPTCRPTDFTSDKWKDCVLITPQNGTQVEWNKMSVSEHRRRTSKQLLVPTREGLRAECKLTSQWSTQVSHWLTRFSDFWGNCA
ncbi:hypothetical protein FRC12_008695, partial [Ceratobasidium sp. 428]